MLVLLFSLSRSANWIEVGQFKISQNASIGVLSVKPFSEISVIMVNQYSFKQAFVNSCPSQIRCISGVPNVPYTKMVKVTNLPTYFNPTQFGIFHFVAYDCQSNTFDRTVDISIYNTWGYLDGRVYPLSYINLAETLVLAVILTIWVIIIINSEVKKSALVRLITWALPLSTFFSFSSTLILILGNTIKNFSICDLVSSLCTSLSVFTILYVMLSIALGLSTVTEHIDLNSQVILILASLAFAASKFVVQILNPVIGAATTVSMVAFGISFFCYVMVFYYLSSTTFTALSYGLSTLDDMGVEVQMTRTFNRMRNLKIIQHSCSFFLLIILSSSILYHMSIISYYTVYGSDIVMGILLWIIIVFFNLPSGGSDVLSTTPPPIEEEMQEIQ